MAGKRQSAAGLAGKGEKAGRKTRVRNTAEEKKTEFAKWIHPHLHIAVIRFQLANRRSQNRIRVISSVKSIFLIPIKNGPRILPISKNVQVFS